MTTTKDIELDLPVDLQTEDESGLPWGLLREARDPELITVGRWIVVGSPDVLAVAQVAEVVGAVVRVRLLPGPVGSHLHRLGRLG